VTHLHVVADVEPDTGWGIICRGSSVAHYYLRGLPVCAKGRAKYLQMSWYYHGNLRSTRGLKTDCRNCRHLLETTP
jgi:hypothetical protein